MSSRENIDIYVRMAGKRQYIRDTAEVAAATRGLDHAIDGVGRTTDRSARRTFLWNQAMFTARRLVYDFTIATGVAAGAVAFLGLKFNATMETNRVALGFMLGSEQAATKELEYLYELAAKTPFAFSELTDVARRFLAFGFTVQEANRYLAATGDAIAAFGGNPEIMQRIVRAFGQIQAKGRLYAEEVLQLTEAGIPAYKYLQQFLGLTADQMKNIGELGIPANAAIEAIVRGMEQLPERGGFKGAAAELSQTVNGQLATIKDYAYQLFGEIMMAPFIAIREQLPNVSETLQEATEAMRDDGFMAMVRAFDEGFNMGGKLVLVVEYLARVFGNLWTILQYGLFPAFMANAKAVGILLLPVLVSLDYLLRFLADHTTILNVVLSILIARFIALRIAALAAVFATGRVAGAFMALRVIAYALFLTLGSLRLRMIAIWSIMALLTKAAIIARTVWAAFTAIMVAYRTGALLAMAATLLLNIVLWANPLVLIGAAVIIVVYALYELEKRFGIVTKAVQWLWDKLKQFYNWLSNNKDKLWNLIPAVGLFNAAKFGISKIPGLASGGVVGSAGMAMVGERGPEMVYLPSGARVERAKPYRMDRDASGMINITIHPAPVRMDGRDVAEVVFSHQQDRFARA